MSNMPCGKMIKKYKFRAQAFKIRTGRWGWVSKTWKTSLSEAQTDIKFADKRMWKSFKIKKQFWKNINPKMVSGTKKERAAIKKKYARLDRQVKRRMRTGGL